MVQYGMCRGTRSTVQFNLVKGSGRFVQWASVLLSLLPSFAKSVRSTITTTQTRHGVGKKGEVGRGRQALERASKQVVKQGGRAGVVGGTGNAAKMGCGMG